jgi:molybdenum cofactor cytidylyltransferase
VTEASRTVALVLAAGSASRFGSPKALAGLDGRPLLQHVLDAAAGIGAAGIVLVLGHDAEAIEAAVDARGATVVRNPDPGRGLASSLRVGLAAVDKGGSRAVAQRDAGPGGLADAGRRAGVGAVLVLLGDQPLVRPAVIAALLRATIPAGRSIVVPAYAAGGGSNPALLLRPAWPLAGDLEGDRGMGPIIAAHPELVVRVPVDGDNPDVDTPADLQRLAREAASR